jgi:chromate transporter
VVGVLLAALYRPVFVEAVRTAPDVALVIAAFGLLEVWKAPPWLVVALIAGTGALQARYW